MHIINSITVQLETILSLMKKDLSNDCVTYKYFIKEVDFKFLNTQELNSYILETKIENQYPLEKINNLCIDIRNLWNSKLGNPIKTKKLKEWFSIVTDNGGFYSGDMAFNVLFLQDDKCTNYTPHQIEITTKLLNELYSSKYLRTDIHKIVRKCLNISTLLTNASHSLEIKEDPEQWLIEYQNFKKFRITGRPYKISDYERMKNAFEDRLFTSRYIFLKLDTEEQLEFKNHVIENLKEIMGMQILPEFKSLLSEIITKSENNFIGSNTSKYQNAIYPFANNKVLDSFKNYTEKHIVEPYVDYSYLFQRLKDKSLINNITHIDFMNWLKENDFISENTLDDFLKQESFRTLNKSFSAQRENNFNNIFSQLI